MQADIPTGPWSFEPNEESFYHEGYQCLILRNTGVYLGHLCGYIAVPERHPWHGVEFDSYCEGCMPEQPLVHGGVTFTGKLPKLEGWTVGFDCAHFGDLMPYLPRMYGSHGKYRDFEFVRHECRMLAEQARRAEAKTKI